MSNYLLGVIEPQGQGIPEPEVLQAIMANVEAVTQEMKSQGVWVAAGGLEETGSAKTVRNGDGQGIVSDGPFVEMKEYLGGFSIIDVDDEETAIEWAKKVSQATTLPIEVRKFRGMLQK